MLVIYQTTTIDDATYIIGWYASPPDNPYGVELDSQLIDVTQWQDENGNPIWLLNEDGSIDPVTIPLSQEQIDLSNANASLADNQSAINDLIPQILDHVVNGDSIPQDLIDQWNNSRQAIQTARSTILSPIKPIKITTGDSQSNP